MKRVGLICPSIRVEDAYHRPAEHLFHASGENTGNFAFVQALYDHMAPNVTMFPWFAPVEAVREQCDVLVMACANQLGPHTDLATLGNWFEKVRLPIVAIGLGAQAPKEVPRIEIKEGTLNWLRAVADHAPTKAPNIGARGAFSAGQIEAVGLGDRVTVTGCPSNFLNPNRGFEDKISERYTSSEIRRVAVAAGFYKWTSLERIERMLANIVDATHGIYVVQSQLEMIRISRGEFEEVGADVAREIKKYTKPDLSDDEFIDWCRRYACSFIDASSWLYAMTKFDFAVGARFHGVMLAFQAGTPGGVIAHDTRTAELCETMRLPFKHFAEIGEKISITDFPTLFHFDPAVYRTRRSELWNEYSNILAAANISISPKFGQLSATL